MMSLALAFSLMCVSPIRVIDGDTIEVCNQERKESVRIAHLDAPESYRPACQKERILGLKAKEVAKRLFSSATKVEINPSSRDRYGRKIASVLVNGQDFATYMIDNGHAVRWTPNKKHDWCKEQ